MEPGPRTNSIKEARVRLLEENADRIIPARDPIVLWVELGQGHSSMRAHLCEHIGEHTNESTRGTHTHTHEITHLRAHITKAHV